MSFSKMWSSLDLLVYLEMLGRAAARQERAALAQPEMALIAWRCDSFEPHCHSCTVSSEAEREETTNLQRGSILLEIQCESISLYNKLAVPCPLLQTGIVGFARKKHSIYNDIIVQFGLFWPVVFWVFLITSTMFFTHVFNKISKPVLCIFSNLHAHLNYISLWIWNILSLSCQSSGI